MAFEGLSEKLQNVFAGLKGKGSLTEADIDTAMREVKLALLEADVNFKVVKEFVASVKEKAMGAEVMSSLTPSQQVIKIVNSELTELTDNIVFSRNRVAGFVGTARLRHGLNILFFKKNLLMQFFQIVAGFHGISFLGLKVILVRPS